MAPNFPPFSATTRERDRAGSYYDLNRKYYELGRIVIANELDEGRMRGWRAGLRIAALLMVGGLALGACGKKPTEHAGSASGPAPAAAKTDFTIAWTIYAGWMPWPYADQPGS
jgi:hypothetical protein